MESQTSVSAGGKSGFSFCRWKVGLLFLPVESQASVSAGGKSGFSFCLWRVKLQFLPVESRASVSASGKSGFCFCRWKVRLQCLPVEGQASVSASGKSGFSFCQWKVRLQFLPVESQASVSASGKSGFSFCQWKIRVWCLQVKRVLFPPVWVILVLFVLLFPSFLLTHFCTAHAVLSALNDSTKVHINVFLVVILRWHTSYCSKLVIRHKDHRSLYSILFSGISGLVWCSVAFVPTCAMPRWLAPGSGDSFCRTEIQNVCFASTGVVTNVGHNAYSCKYGLYKDWQQQFQTSTARNWIYTGCFCWWWWWWVFVLKQLLFSVGSGEIVRDCVNVWDCVNISQSAV